MELNHDITGSYSFQRCIGCEYFGSRDILVYESGRIEYPAVIGESLYGPERIVPFEEVRKRQFTATGRNDLPESPGDDCSPVGAGFFRQPDALQEVVIIRERAEEVLIAVPGGDDNLRAVAVAGAGRIGFFYAVGAARTVRVKCREGSVVVSEETATMPWHSEMIDVRRGIIITATYFISDRQRIVWLVRGLQQLSDNGTIGGKGIVRYVVKRKNVRRDHLSGRTEKIERAV